MPINMPDKKGSGLGNIVGAAGKIAGIASGDPLKIAATMGGNSPLGMAVKGYQGISNALSGGGAQTPTDPMGRRISNDPALTVHAGLAAADDPNLPLDYETRMAVIEPLLRAKHFGPGGGLA